MPGKASHFSFGLPSTVAVMVLGSLLNRRTEMRLSVFTLLVLLILSGCRSTSGTVRVSIPAHGDQPEVHLSFSGSGSSLR